MYKPFQLTLCQSVRFDMERTLYITYGHFKPYDFDNLNEMDKIEKLLIDSDWWEDKEALSIAKKQIKRRGQIGYFTPLHI